MYSEAHVFRIYAQGADAVLRLIGKLEELIGDLQGQVTRSPQPLIVSLREELKKTKGTLDRKTIELIKERQLNHLLRQRIRELELAIECNAGSAEVQRDSHNSSLPPSLDPPWKKVKRTRSLRVKTGRKAGGQPGHKGATLLQVNEPDTIIVHRPVKCGGCCAVFDALLHATAARRQVFDISDGRLKVTEHRAQTLICPSCLATNRANFPAGVRAPVQYGPGVISRAVYLRFYQLIPVARTSETMRDLFGCNLSPATVERAGLLCSAKLVRCEQRIKAAIRDSPVIGADETGLRVAGGGGWVHVARTGKHTHYGYDKRRGKAAMDEIGILPGFKGTMVRDGWASYKWYQQCRHSLCNAHLLRELVYIKEADPAQEAWVDPFVKLLLAAKEAASDSKQGDKHQISPSRKNYFLSQYEKIIKIASKLNPEPQKRIIGPGPPNKPATRPTFRSIIKRLEKKRDDVLRFMTDLSVPFDNNGSERDLRMVKLIQKISGCFRTGDGARTFCRIRSYVSTAGKQGHSLLRAVEKAANGRPLSVGC